jgi:hypothetical protein
MIARTAKAKTMDSELIERLRILATHPILAGPPDPENYGIMFDAEVCCRAAAAGIADNQEIALLKAEVKGLRRINENNESVRIAELEAEVARLRRALENINRKASPDPERTMSEASNDLYWCACEARAAVQRERLT